MGSGRPEAPRLAGEHAAPGRDDFDERLARAMAARPARRPSSYPKVMPSPVEARLVRTALILAARAGLWLPPRFTFHFVSAPVTALGTGHLGNGIVTNPKIGSGAVNTPQLSGRAVTTAIRQVMSSLSASHLENANPRRRLLRNHRLQP